MHCKLVDKKRLVAGHDFLVHLLLLLLGYSVVCF